MMTMLKIEINNNDDSRYTHNEHHQNWARIEQIESVSFFVRHQSILIYCCTCRFKSNRNMNAYDKIWLRQILNDRISSVIKSLNGLVLRSQSQLFFLFLRVFSPCLATFLFCVYFSKVWVFGSKLCCPIFSMNFYW